MNLYRFALKNIIGNSFRSLAILVVAALVAGLALVATTIVQGARGSLQSNLSRLGADILVVPWGSMTEQIKGIRLMSAPSAPVDGWMPASKLQEIASLQGVAQVSPQVYLASLEDSPYSPYPKSHLVAFDPKTDFTLGPWLEEIQMEDINDFDAIAGANISLPTSDQSYAVYGSSLNIIGRLAPTETSIDDTLFVSMETAEHLIQGAKGQIDIIPGTLTAIMVRLTLDSDPSLMATQILEEVQGVTPLETPNLYQAERRQMIGILRILLGSLGGIWILAVVFIGLVFSFAVNERRSEIGALRAIGFPSQLIFKILLLEGSTLAVIGGFTGVFLTIIGFYLFGNHITQVTNLPLAFPTTANLVSLSLSGQTLAVISVTLAVFFPAWRISHEEVALMMKE